MGSPVVSERPRYVSRFLSMAGEEGKHVVADQLVFRGSTRGGRAFFQVVATGVISVSVVSPVAERNSA